MILGFLRRMIVEMIDLLENPCDVTADVWTRTLLLMYIAGVGPNYGLTCAGLHIHVHVHSVFISG